MRNILAIGATLAIALSVGQTAWAQSEMTAMSVAAAHEARGSARYQALSGAMGAVGADFSSIHQNPAGIALFRSGTKFSFTSSLSSLGSSADWGAGAYRTSRTKFNIDELSYLTSWQTASGGTWTLGLGVQNNGRLTRKMDAAYKWSGVGSTGFSLADYSAAILNRQGSIPPPTELGKLFAADAPWLGVIAYNNGWIDHNSRDGGYQSAYSFDGRNNEGPQTASLITDESGAITNYQLALGFQPSSSFSFGFMMTTTSFNQSYRSYYTEGFYKRARYDDVYGLSLDNGYELSGYGIRFGLGLIAEPIDKLRLGASIYTPTFYTLEMDVLSKSSTGVSPIIDRKGAIETLPPSAANAFELRTPWRFGLSAAYVFGRAAILSADYEYSNMGGVRLGTTSSDNGYYDDGNRYKEDNAAIKSDFGGQHTLRLGLETNISRRFALRGGYRMITAPKTVGGLSRDVPTWEAYVSGPAVHYRLPGMVSSFSLGAGYRLSPQWTLDFAYVYRVQNDKVYAFPFIHDVKQSLDIHPMSAIKDRQTNHQFVATLSYRI